MARSFTVVTDEGPRPTCAKPEHLPLVDAAFARPGGPEAKRMKATLCTGCPIGERCLTWAMTRREDGIWGGTGPNTRTRHGAPGRANPGGQTSSAPRRILAPYRPRAAADVPVATIRAWALEHGLPVNPIKGRISEAIREQYVEAHRRTA